eukprot:3174983-Amphidinium_carterae.2
MAVLRELVVLLASIIAAREVRGDQSTHTYKEQEAVVVWTDKVSRLRSYNSPIMCAVRTQSQCHVVLC